MYQKLLFLFLCIICSSCNKNLSQNERFFIPKHGGNEGIVNKYYRNVYLKDQQDPRTYIDYSLIKKLNDSIYRKEIYGPDFKILSSNQFSIQGNHMIEVSAQRFYGKDTLTAVYQEEAMNYYLTFNQDTVYYKAKLKNNTSRYIDDSRSIKMVKDTTIESKPAKIVEQNIINTSVFGENQKKTTNFYSRSIYVQDLGLYASTLTTDAYRIERILVEQLLPSDFNNLSQHNIKRVGYIDFNKTIDKDKELVLCGDHDYIADYYNGANDRAGFIGGKGSLKRLVFSKLDLSKLKNESGYLTFRFVINCKGKAGKFTTDQTADFEYNKKEFPEETIMHLYDIISNVKQWKPCVIRNTERDSYFYITFILKNGKIQDILP
ncbi:hypothetical protein SAMN04487910_0554 [Aquimarina amphilecti]|uniref:Uncharacterized protein n=1 Tax=Aquimarina amphilecti TaxID=1038014 RepID=A0A1H7H3D9_AQUAM|nr:hypothetical protein [Aquimarina amphilecti]SEK44923.1 hypothetical protein SAMN04487910_0554 [Aquimarina amphilecti]